LKKALFAVFAAAAIVVVVIGLSLPNDDGRLDVFPRKSKIPEDAIKMMPESDEYPPQLHSGEYEEPVPMPGPINTAGAEDSPFILPCGCTFYFVFVPDVDVPPEKQLIDGASGIYVSNRVNGTWAEPERIVLNDDVSLDGCHFVQGDVMWFCSVRKENHREVDLYTAEFKDGEWTNWRNLGEKLNVDYQVGEMHITSDGTELYFHSSREGGNGGVDIWVTRKVDGEWQEPENIEAVNTEANEGMPFLTQDGKELWFNRPYLGSPAIYRSRKVNDEWQEPELIISQFAGEPSLDDEGNIYFVHHFYKDGKMIEADIYVSCRKQLKKGVSLSPRSSSQDDFLDFFEKAKQTGKIVMWAGDWNELGKTEGGGPRVVAGLASTYNYIPLVEVTTHSGGELLRPLNETTKQIYKNSAVAFAEEFTPAYLGLGIEINALYENAPEDFDEFADFYNEVFDDVKAVSPNTKIFTVFQLEKLKGHTLWSSEPANPDDAQWFLIDRFKTDICAFTTYPGLVHRNPSDIPENYYAEIGNYTTKPIAFTEIGWHSEASPLGWESSEAEQAEFIETFFTLTEDLDMEIAIWSWIYDPSTIEPFRSMGLRHNDGTARPAWEAWLSGE